MATLREKGYCFMGWELGEKVRIKKDGKEYTIIGFDEGTEEKAFIAIDRSFYHTNITESHCVQSCIITDKNYYDWVTEDEIEKIGKIKNNVEERGDEMKKEEATNDIIKSAVKDYESFLLGNIIKNILEYKISDSLDNLKEVRDSLEILISEKFKKN